MVRPPSGCAALVTPLTSDLSAEAIQRIGRSKQPLKKKMKRSVHYQKIDIANNDNSASTTHYVSSLSEGEVRTKVACKCSQSIGEVHVCSDSSKSMKVETSEYDSTSSGCCGRKRVVSKKVQQFQNDNPDLNIVRHVSRYSNWHTFYVSPIHSETSSADENCCSQ